MKVIVCGGRDYLNRDVLDSVLGRLLERYGTDLHVIEGGARGVDSYAGYYFRTRNVEVTTVRADWDTHGRKAGYLRNVEMADMQPDMVVAFPGGRGTQMMRDIAAKRGIPVYVVLPNAEVKKWR